MLSDLKFFTTPSKTVYIALTFLQRRRRGRDLQTSETTDIVHVTPFVTDRTSGSNKSPTGMFSGSEEKTKIDLVLHSHLVNVFSVFSPPPRLEE